MLPHIPVNKFRIARLIRSHRYLNRLTQTELAKMLGISRNSVVQYEIAQRLPSAAMLKKLSSALDIPETAFFKDETQNNFTDEIGKKYMRNFCYLKNLAEDRNLREFVKFYTENRKILRVLI